MTRYIIYSRKSTEDEDSQVQSISDQEKEMQSLAAKFNLPLFEPLSEAKSAKAPGRPVFGDMMNRIERGEIQGILCWKLDRLARNPVDGGRIIWAIKQHGLVVRTPHQTFSREQDNFILMYMEFGIAQKYVDDLSRNTIRGLKSKAQKGWFPGVASVGYLNSKIEERGHRKVLIDPERFHVVRRMWDLMLTGKYSPTRIQKIVNEEWGFRTRRTKKTGGKPLSRSAIYKLFSDPFYYGRFEYPAGSGQWYHGAHEPMITEAEFQSVKKILSQRNNPRPQQEFDLPFRGLFKCGGCRSSITAHFKEQVRCTQCHYKSSVKNRDSCSKCNLPLAKMTTAKTRRYAYYHCTRTLNPLCREKAISARALEQQIAASLKQFGLPTEFREWGLKYIDTLRDDEFNQQKQILEERKKAYAMCVTRLENLVKLQTAPENADGSLLSNEEYQKQRADLLIEKDRLSFDASSFQTELDGKARRIKGALHLVGQIDEPSPNGDSWRQSDILRAIGLNHLIKEKKLEIKPEFPFSELPRSGNGVQRKSPTIEPDSGQGIQSWNGNSDPAKLTLERGVDDDRTKKLEIALKSIWKKIDPCDYAFEYYPFTEKRREYRPSRRRGRFVSPVKSSG